MAAASAAKTDQKTQMESMGSMYSVFKKHTDVPWYLIDPRYSNRLAAWDGLNALALIFTALVTPFEVAFMPPERRAASVRFVLNRAIDIFFLFDMIIQLFIMYPQEKALKVDPKKQTSSAMKEMLQPKSHVEMVMSQRKIARHYFTSWFLIDLISVLTCIIDILPVVQAENERAAALAQPLKEASSGPLSEEEGMDAVNQLRIVRVLRVLRLIKLVRLLKTSRILARWQTSIALDFSTQTVIYCLVSYLLCGHWFACLLVLTTTFASTPYHTWLWRKGFCLMEDDLYFSEHSQARLASATWDFTETVKINGEVLGDLYCVSPWDLWAGSFYWMIMLVSGAAGGDTNQGDMNASEQLVFTVLVIGSCLLLSQIVASFCEVLANLNPERTAFRNNMDHLNRYCRSNRLDTPTRRRLREYLYRAKHLQVHNSNRKLMLLMSPKLQGELSLQVNGPWLINVSFLRGAELTCVVRVALALEPMVFVPTELLPTDYLYYLEAGTVVHRSNVFVRGQYWGTECLLERPEFRSKQSRALTYAETCRVHRDNLFGIIFDAIDGENLLYPNAAMRCRWVAIKMALVRYAATQSTGKRMQTAWTDTFQAMALDLQLDDDQQQIIPGDNSPEKVAEKANRTFLSPTAEKKNLSPAEDVSPTRKGKFASAASPSTIDTEAQRRLLNVEGELRTLRGDMRKVLELLQGKAGVEAVAPPSPELEEGSGRRRRSRKSTPSPPKLQEGADAGGLVRGGIAKQDSWF